MIYLLGSNALTCFLAAKIQLADIDACIISDKRKTALLSTEGVNIKEEHSLQRKHYAFNTTPHTGDRVDLLIISCDASELKAHLTMISPRQLKNADILMFTMLKDAGYVKQVLKKEIIYGYFDGYLSYSGKNITLHGRAPVVSIVKNKKNSNLQKIKDIFEQSELMVSIGDDSKSAYWGYFAPLAIGSIFTYCYKKSISAVIKNTELRERLKDLTESVLALAQMDGADIKREDLLAKIYSTPSNYEFPPASAICPVIQPLCQKYGLVLDGIKDIRSCGV